MQRTLTPTLALILAGGLAAGIGLARPASTATTAITPAPTGDQPVGADGADRNEPYRRGNREAGQRGAAEPAAAPATTPADGPGQAVIIIEGFAFDGPASVASGTSLQVTNLDGANHTLTFRSGEADTGTIAGGTTTALTTPVAPGTYAFFCRIHPSMEGRIVIEG